MCTNVSWMLQEYKLLTSASHKEDSLEYQGVLEVHNSQWYMLDCLNLIFIRKRENNSKPPQNKQNTNPKKTLWIFEMWCRPLDWSEILGWFIPGYIIGFHPGKCHDFLSFSLNSCVQYFIGLKELLIGTYNTPSISTTNKADVSVLIFIKDKVKCEMCLFPVTIL